MTETLSVPESFWRYPAKTFRNAAIIRNPHIQPSATRTPDLLNTAILRREHTDPP